MESITLLITGGTLDKKYNERNGQLEFSKSHCKEIIENNRASLKINYKELMLVDSLDMTPEQRTEIVASCINATDDKIVITHGTDTMVITASEIAKQNLSKTIVLTGAMIPFSLKKSEAEFNIGSALAFAQTLSAGVYIAMNGQFFKWDNVQKNIELGKFETLANA